MGAASAASLLKHFESLPDPRDERNRKQLLVDVAAIAVCGVLVGCDGPTALRLWAQEREGWLREFLALPGGLPSKDCLRRVLSLLNPEAFTRRLGEWIAERPPRPRDREERLATDEAGRLIAIDGKTLRRSHDRKHVARGQRLGERGRTFVRATGNRREVERNHGDP